MDHYPTFEELKKSEKEGEDFLIFSKKVQRSKILIISPHGGEIECRTEVIAERIAEDNFSLYQFISCKNGIKLHITSSRFDEPRCIELVKEHEIVIAIHGCVGEDEEIFVGGRDNPLMDQFLAAFRAVNILANKSKKWAGTKKKNICNRGKTGQGIQFELTAALRNNSKTVDLFVKTVQKILGGMK